VVARDAGLAGQVVQALVERPSDRGGVERDGRQIVRNGFVSIRPGDAVGAPSTSSLNFEAGDIVANAVTLRLPTTGVHAGMIEITYDAYGVAAAKADILIDVVGYYVGSPPTLVP
jgi:hypothetical protein